IPREMLAKNMGPGARAPDADITTTIVKNLSKSIMLLLSFRFPRIKKFSKRKFYKIYQFKL
ncbi:hypothetical protein CW709_05410, partial [Candidatus Bathyarchaeota archaeon]